MAACAVVVVLVVKVVVSWEAGAALAVGMILPPQALNTTISISRTDPVTILARREEREEWIRRERIGWTIVFFLPPGHYYLIGREDFIINLFLYKIYTIDSSLHTFALDNNDLRHKIRVRYITQ